MCSSRSRAVLTRRRPASSASRSRVTERSCSLAWMPERVFSSSALLGLDRTRPSSCARSFSVRSSRALARGLDLQLAHAVDDRRVLRADPAQVVGAHEQVAEAVGVEHHRHEVGLIGLVDRDEARREHVLRAAQLLAQPHEAAVLDLVARTRALQLRALCGERVCDAALAASQRADLAPQRRGSCR